jgi:glycosyltransferase involved in cell wall biosynthesis
MKNNISLLAAIKNNLEYTQYFYKTTRQIYPEIEICFSSHNSTDGTDEWLESLKNDPYTKVFYTQDKGNFSDNYNKAASLATKDYVAFVHNDIVLAPGFIENLEKHTTPDTIVSYTTIEPPIFAGHERPGKIIYDLGTELDTFSIEKLYQFANEKQIEYKDKIEQGIVFFMCMPKDKYSEIGGLDNLYNPMFCEDDDLILRWTLAKMNLITSLDSICYHFVSKTSRFSEEYKQHTQQIELNSNRNFVRKWGSRNPKVKYNIGFVIHNCNQQLLEVLEPWCDNIYVNCETESYINREQLNTKLNLKDRVRSYMFNDKEKSNNILIEFDATKLNQNNFQLLQQLPEIIQESGEIGKFELDIFKVIINSLETYEHTLIKL